MIELLVVLLIMGLLAGLAVVAVRPDERGLLRLETERLARLLELAASEARLTGNSLAWGRDGAGYRFWRQVGQPGASAPWLQIRDDDLLRARALPPDMAITGLRIDGARARADQRIVFNPYGPALAFAVDLSFGDARTSIEASPIGDLRVLPDDGGSHAGMALQ